MMPGRNAPCPCGSGKKHKRCCLAAAESIPFYDLDDPREQSAGAAALRALIERAARDGAIVHAQDDWTVRELPEGRTLVSLRLGGD